MGSGSVSVCQCTTLVAKISRDENVSNSSPIFHSISTIFASTLPTTIKMIDKIGLVVIIYIIASTRIYLHQGRQDGMRTNEASGQMKRLEMAGPSLTPVVLPAKSAANCPGFPVVITINQQSGAPGSEDKRQSNTLDIMIKSRWRREPRDRHCSRYSLSTTL